MIFQEVLPWSSFSELLGSWECILQKHSLNRCVLKMVMIRKWRHTWYKFRLFFSHSLFSLLSRALFFPPQSNKCFKGKLRFVIFESFFSACPLLLFFGHHLNGWWSGGHILRPPLIWPPHVWPHLDLQGRDYVHGKNTSLQMRGSPSQRQRLRE